MVIVGVVGYVGGAVLSRIAYGIRRPGASRAGIPPMPGTGDVPSWISGLQPLFLVVGVIGIIVWIVA